MSIKNFQAPKRRKENTSKKETMEEQISSKLYLAWSEMDKDKSCSEPIRIGGFLMLLFGMLKLSKKN